MKKLLLFVTAIAMLGLVSCQSDKPENPNDTALSEPIEEIPTEPVFMKYDQSDFKEINVAITNQKGEPVVDVNTYALKSVADNKEMSPCKLPENRNKIMDEVHKELYFRYYVWDEEAGEHVQVFDEEGFNNYCDEPSEAFFNVFSVSGDKVAMYADYDEVCEYGHCYKLFEYDIKTEEIRELYSFSSDKEGEDISDITYFGGELYVIRKHEGSPKEVCRFTDGKFEPLFTTDDISADFDEYLYFQFIKQDTEKLMVFVNSNRLKYENTDSDMVVYEYDLVEYDTEMGELSEVYHEENEASIKKWTDNKILVNGNDIIHSVVDGNRDTCIVGNNFRINTGIRGLQLQAAEGNRIIAWVDDTVKKELYTYDLDKMECYISNITSVSDVSLVGGNVMLTYGASGIVSHNLLIPELGASFNIFRSTRGLYRGYDGGKMWTIDAADGWSNYSDEDGATVYFSKDGNAVGTLVIIG